MASSGFLSAFAVFSGVPILVEHSHGLRYSPPEYLSYISVCFIQEFADRRQQAADPIKCSFLFHFIASQFTHRAIQTGALVTDIYMAVQGDP
jgi:hypothetical protein